MIIFLSCGSLKYFISFLEVDMLDQKEQEKCIEKGLFYLDKGELEKALYNFSKVIQSQEEEKDNFFVMHGLYGRSLVFKQQQKKEQALEDLEKCFSLIGSPTIFSNHIYCRVCHEIGEFYFLEENFEKALDFFSKALKSDSSKENKVDILKTMVICYSLLDQYENVLMFAKIGLSYKDDPFFHSKIIMCTKNLTEAIFYAEKVLKNFPQDIDLHYYYALVLRDSGEYDKSLRELLLCLSFDSEFEQAKIIIEDLSKRIYGDKTANSL